MAARTVKYREQSVSMESERQHVPLPEHKN